MAVGYDLPPVGTNRSVSTSAPQALPGMSDIYGNLLNLSTQNYQNVANLYQQGQNNLEARIPLINNEYLKLATDVQNQLTNAYQPALRDIQAGFSQQSGALQQQLTSAGLGNTTKGGNLSNQLLDMANRSRERVASQYGQQVAGYLSDIGQHRLAAVQQGLGMMTGLNQNAMGVLGGYHFPAMPGPLYGQVSSSVGPPAYHGGTGVVGGGTSGSAMGGGGAGGIGGLQNMLGGLGGMLGGGGGRGMGDSYGYAGPGYAQAGYGNFNPYYGAGMLGGQQTVYPGGEYGSGFDYSRGDPFANNLSSDEFDAGLVD